VVNHLDDSFGWVAGVAGWRVVLPVPAGHRRGPGITLGSGWNGGLEQAWNFGRSGGGMVQSRGPGRLGGL